MVKKSLTTPDYKFWSKLDVWSFKDAALLLHELDPLELKQARFSTREAPAETKLKEPYKTFLLFKSVDWRRYLADNSVHPLEIYAVALHKELPIPEELNNHLKERREKELAIHMQAKTPIETKQNGSQLSTRERQGLLKALGIMTLLLTEDSKYSSKFRINERPNAFAIAATISEKATKLGISADGIKSLNRKIKEALELLEEK